MLNNRLNSDDRPLADCRLGTLTGKTQITVTGMIRTSALGAQSVATFNVPSTHTFYLQYLDIVGYRATISATAAVLGSCNLETLEGASFNINPFVNPTTSQITPVNRVFVEPVFVTANTTIRVRAVPNDSTATLWTTSFGGYLISNA